MKRYIRELANDMIKKGHDSEKVNRVLYYSDMGLISDMEVVIELANIIMRKREEN